MKRLDRELTRGLARYGLAVALLTPLVAATVPGFDLPRAFLVANMLALSVAVVAIAWTYGQEQCMSAGARRFFMVLAASTCAGAAFALWIKWLEAGSVTALFPANSKLADTDVLLGSVAVALLYGRAETRRRAAAERAYRTQAELKLLQAQIEPHFLFNTLANLRHLVQTGSREALPMLDHLVDYLRTALPEIRTASSTVGREIELARAYLEIMRIRMGGALDFTIEMPESVAQEAFPPLMLITLVENAVKHGVAPRAGGRIAIRVARAERGLGMAVEDDGPGLSQPAGRGMGLANLRERLRALYGDAARLDLAQREGGGMRAVIEIPA